jgi:two-component system response regulator WspF
MRIAIASHINIKRVSEIIRKTRKHEIAWSARNGTEVLDKYRSDPPDLMLMALEMPVMDGIETTRKLLKQSTCPILLLTESMDVNISRVCEALHEGALDTVNIVLNGDDVSHAHSKAKLLRKIATMEKLYASRSPSGGTSRQPCFSEHMPDLIAIGSSAGGPKTLAALRRQLPGNLNAAIVIVQHVDQMFSAGFADWLNDQTELTVQLAEQDQRPQKANVYIARGDRHLVVSRTCRFAYTLKPSELPYRPSVNILFTSIARHWPQKSVAILLTGMGNDGAQGLALLRRNGWHTIAQDQNSSLVYGMPKAAKKLDAATQILPIETIGRAIIDQLNARHHLQDKLP